MRIRRRLILKGIIWELTGLLLVYLLTGSLEISITYTLIRTVMYYFYHILWKKIKWGKNGRRN